jgi:hypothetical protein
MSAEDAEKLLDSQSMIDFKLLAATAKSCLGQRCMSSRAQLENGVAISLIAIVDDLASWAALSRDIYNFKFQKADVFGAVVDIGRLLKCENIVKHFGDDNKLADWHALVASVRTFAVSMEESLNQCLTAKCETGVSALRKCSSLINHVVSLAEDADVYAKELVSFDTKPIEARRRRLNKLVS